MSNPSDILAICWTALKKINKTESDGPRRQFDWYCHDVKLITFVADQLIYFLAYLRPVRDN